MKNIVKNEPVMVSHGVLAVLGWIATFLIDQHWVTAQQANSAITAVAPTAVMLVIAGIGFLVRKYVIPVVKVAEGKIPAAVNTVPQVQSFESSLSAALAGLAGLPAGRSGAADGVSGTDASARSDA